MSHESRPRKIYSYGTVLLWCAALALVVAMAVLRAGGAWAQQRGSGGGNFPQPPQTTPTIPNLDTMDMPSGGVVDPMRRKIQQRQFRALNNERQRSMVADANRLVKLASDLNDQINGEHPGQLTADQLRELADIEKLAHSVRTKMSSPPLPPPSYNPGPRVMYPQ